MIAPHPKPARLARAGGALTFILSQLKRALEWRKTKVHAYMQARQYEFAFSSFLPTLIQPPETRAAPFDRKRTLFRPLPPSKSGSRDGAKCNPPPAPPNALTTNPSPYGA